METAPQLRSVMAIDQLMAASIELINWSPINRSDARTTKA
jgi:hypothetical protein